MEVDVFSRTISVAEGLNKLGLFIPFSFVNSKPLTRTVNLLSSSNAFRVDLFSTIIFSRVFVTAFVNGSKIFLAS